MKFFLNLESLKSIAFGGNSQGGWKSNAGSFTTGDKPMFLADLKALCVVDGNLGIFFLLKIFLHRPLWVICRIHRFLVRGELLKCPYAFR